MSGEIQDTALQSLAGEPSDEELAHIELEEAAWEDPLEELFTEALLSRKPKPHSKSPAKKDALAVASAWLKARYADPKFWTRQRGVALVDLETGTLLGNFSEYLHEDGKSRKWLREHQPISIDGTELINGYLGAELERKVREVSWEKEFHITVAVQLEELMIEAPAVQLRVMTRFEGIVRADLCQETQFACASGNAIFRLPAGVNIWEACSTDTKIRVRKGLPK